MQGQTMERGIWLQWFYHVVKGVSMHLHFLFGLNMVLVPANMSRLSFDPCKIKILFFVPAKFFVF